MSIEPTLSVGAVVSHSSKRMNRACGASSVFVQAAISAATLNEVVVTGLGSVAVRDTVTIASVPNLAIVSFVASAMLKPRLGRHATEAPRHQLASAWQHPPLPVSA